MGANVVRMGAQCRRRNAKVKNCVNNGVDFFDGNLSAFVIQNARQKFTSKFTAKFTQKFTSKFIPNFKEFTSKFTPEFASKCCGGLSKIHSKFTLLSCRHDK